MVDRKMMVGIVLQQRQVQRLEFSVSYAVGIVGGDCCDKHHWKNSDPCRAVALTAQDIVHITAAEKYLLIVQI